MKSTSALHLVQSAVVAALYVTLTLVSQSVGLASGVIQIRVSEALCVLPFFEPHLCIGLYIGCILANLLTGCAALDVIFDSLATLIGGIGCALIGKAAAKYKADSAAYKRLAFLSPLPNVLSNTVIIPPILAYVYHATDFTLFGHHFVGTWWFALTIFIGEMISGYLFGILLFPAFHRVMRQFH